MRKFVILVLFLLLILSSCSKEFAPSSSGDILLSNNADGITEASVLIEDSELINENSIIVSVENGHIVGNSGIIHFDVLVPTDYPSVANVYKISSDYPFLSVPESYFNVYTESTHWFDYYLYSENQWDPNIEPLYATQALTQSYRNTELTDDSISFSDYALSNRINNIEIINLDGTCIDFLEALNLNINNYNEAIYCNYCAPDGTVYLKYNIPQQIDGINVFDCAVYPQYSSQLGFVNWNGYIGIVAAMSSNGTSISFSLINDNNSVCLTDLHNYEIDEMVDGNLSIIPLEDCINSNFSYFEFTNGYPVSALGGNTWFYLADLVYLPVWLIDETTGGRSEDNYLFPCWVLFYTRIIDNSGYFCEVDGVVALNAITGENIDVADEIYEENWSE